MNSYIMHKCTNHKRTPPPPTPHTPPSPSIHHQPSRTLQDSLVSGFGLGLGNNIANKLISGLFTSSPSPTTRIVINKPSNNCNDIITELDTCILHNGVNDCNELYKKLYECQHEN